MDSKEDIRQEGCIHFGKLQSIQLAAVNFEDDTFRITTKTDIDDLGHSIRQLGLLNYPIFKKEPSGYIIISGFRRIAAYSFLGRTQIQAKVLQPEIDDDICVRCAIADNAFQRSLNLVEVSRSLSLLSSCYKDDKNLVEAASFLGLPNKLPIIKKIEKICHLAKPIQAGILANTISLTMASELSTFEPDTGIALAQLFDYLKLSLNKQRELLLFFKEISIRENVFIRSLLEERKIKEILDDYELDRSQKARKIRSLLKRRRFPTIFKVEKEFEKHLDNLNLGKNIKLVPPKDFEGSTFTLNMKFNRLSELNELHQRLSRIIQNPALNKILR